MTKITLMAREFVRAVSAAASVVDRNANSPIMRAVRLSVKDGTASLSATNNAQYVSITVAADGDGEIHVDANALAAKVNALKPDQPVELSISDKSVTISQGRARWRLPLILGDFPEPEKVTGKKTKVGAEFFDAISMAMSAAAEDDTRQYLNGVLIDAGHLVGGNGYILSAVPTPGVDKLPRIIIPIGTVQKLVRIYKDAEQVSVTASEYAIMFDDGSVSFRSVLIGEAYPDWSKIAATGHVAWIATDAAKMMAAVDRAGNVTQVGKTALVIKVDPGDGEVVLSVDNRQGETGEDVCEAEFEGDVPAFGVAARYLGPMLQSLGGRVRIGIIDASKPMRVEREDGAHGYRIVSPLLV